jgi:replicative DNA helicase
MDRIEDVILHSLITNQEYVRKVLPFLKTEYFSDSIEDSKLFGVIKGYVEKYNDLPSKTALRVEIDGITDINERSFAELKKLIDRVSKTTESYDFDWLVNNTEKFCQDKALYLGLMESIQVAESEKKNSDYKGLTKTSIPKILTDALSVSFDNKIGHDYLSDFEDRFKYYTEKVNRLRFDIDVLNIATGGGLPPKSLTILVAGPGVGKSLNMCHFAANNLTEGKNVLYITLEMSEQECAKRIDANLLDIDISEISKLPKTKYTREFNELKAKNLGKLIIKEYPPASAHVGHFRHLLDELKVKKNFVPNVIYIDYLNICSSSRVKMSGSINSYTFIKSVAEELRGIAVEFDVPVITATQINRGGHNNSEIDLDNISESFGTAATADFIFGIISTEQLAELGQYMYKQLKNRYNDITKMKKFVVGVAKNKMRLYNLESSAQSSLSGNESYQPQQTKKKFGELKV